MKGNKHLLLWCSLGTLALLVWAAAHELFFQEWRRVQQEYQRRLPPDKAAQFKPLLRQVVAPALKSTDRCVTCHLGMAPGETAIEGDRVFGAHPPVVHDPAAWGCTVCHGGQGRATQIEDAHGTAHFWPSPMLPARYSYAGCGGCHTHLQVANFDQWTRGRALFERFDCLRCHSVAGRGGTLRPAENTPASPDLSRAGASGYDANWYETHLEKTRQDETGVWKDSFGEIPEAERAAIDVYLSSLVGAGELIEAKAMFHSVGCRGCHKVHGVGGDDGPDLSLAGQKDPGQLDFTHVPGGRSVPAWFAEHFRAPAKIVPGSLMPEMGLSQTQIDKLNLYMLSLRRTNAPEAFWPRDRVRTQYLHEREFSTDGATLYGSFCAACHGDQGQGVRYPGMKVFPAIANPDFLALASDEFILAAVTRGRPGERMPAWGEKEGGLRPQELQELVRYVRQLGGGIAPVSEDQGWRAAGDPAAGQQLFEQNCASCHGVKGKGAEGPALGNRVFLETASDAYLLESIRRGRRGTTMPGFVEPSTVHRTLNRAEIESIVTYIRSWESAP